MGSKVTMAIAIVLVLSVGLVSASVPEKITLKPYHVKKGVFKQNLFQGWDSESTGAEKVLYDISKLTTYETCLVPKDKSLKPIKVRSCSGETRIHDKNGDVIQNPSRNCNDIFYSYPSNLTKKELPKEKNKETKELPKDLAPFTKEFCYALNPLESLMYKIGLASVTISGDTSYTSTDTNVTQETGFAHLNISDKNLISYYPFDYPDDVNATWVPGQFGNGLELNGQNEMVFVDSVLQNVSTNTVGSFSVWVNIDDVGSNFESMISFGNTSTQNWFHLFIDNSTGNLSFDLRKEGSFQWRMRSEEQVVTSGQWHHIAGVQDGVEPVLYVDGVEIAQTFITSTDKTAWFNDINLNTASLGGIRNFFGVPLTGNYLDGVIDEMKIYDFPLNITQVIELNNTNTVTGVSPVADWTMNQSSGLEVLDFSGNNLNGALIREDITGYDYSQNNNDGTFGGISYPISDGLIGNAVSFDGESGFIDVDGIVSDTSSNTEGTWTAWARRPKAIPDNSEIIFSVTTSDNNTRFIMYNVDGELRGLSTIGGFTQWLVQTDSQIFFNDSWVHVALVQNGTQPVLYVNGTAVPQTNVENADNSSWFSNVSDLDSARIGDYNYDSLGEVLHWEGDIDEVNIFNTSLSSSEISDMFSNSSSRFYPTGEMLFTGLDLSDSSSTSIVLTNCQTLKASSLSAKIDGGSFENFVNCSIPQYNLVGIPSLASTNLTIKFTAGTSNFYSPLIAGNISLVTSPVSGANTNVTDEPAIGSSSGFSHLNISDLDVLAYYNFDYPRDASWVPGQFGNALDFDGTNDRVDFAQSLDSTLVGSDKNWTIAGFIKMDSGSDGSTVSFFNNWRSQEDNRSIFIGKLSTDKIILQLSQAGTATTTQYETANTYDSSDGWIHVTVTYNSNLSVDDSVRIYIDGVNDTVKTVGAITTNPIYDPEQSYTFGAFFGTSDYQDFFDGQADELKIFNKSLSESEALSLSNNIVTDPSSLVRSWSLNQTEGVNVLDTSIASNNGSAIGYVTTAFDYTDNDFDGHIDKGAFPTAEGLIGDALETDGVNVSVQLGDISVGGSEDITVAGWFYFKDTLGFPYLVTKEEGGVTFPEYELREVGNVTRFSIRAASTTYFIDGGTTLLPNNWYHIAGVYDGTDIRVYLNGVSDATPVSATGAINANPTNTTIGADARLSSSVFNGMADEIMIINDSLSAAQILALHNNQSERFFPTGTKTFTSLDFLAPDNKADIQLDDCQTLFGTNLSLMVNNGPAINLTNCGVSDYDLSNVSGNLSEATLQFNYFASPNNFYTPLAIGNITITLTPFGPPVVISQILPNFENTSPHIKLGQRLIFP